MDNVYELSKDQIKMCKRIEKLMKKAYTMGICFYGKCNDIACYTDTCSEIMSPYNSGDRAEHYDMSGVLSDSGADEEEYLP